ncbi:hypothetical protein [Antarctobacter jejuensis]|uniref:hypothetical protein n=1 Tax=Antarctobacter jejuensis TaxID=1439938 RepID=UPI003FD59E70
MTQRRSPPRSETDADDSYQLDAVVSLFAMMLVILVTTAAATAIGTTRFDYTSSDPETAPIQPASLAAPFPRLETWLLRAEGLIRIDYDAATALLAAAPVSDALGATDPATGIDLFLTPSPDIGAFTEFRLNLPEVPITENGGLIAQVIAPDDGAAITAWAQQETPARIAAFVSGRPYLPALVAAAEEAGRPVTVIFREGNRLYEERKIRESFGFRGVLRSY